MAVAQTRADNDGPGTRWLDIDDFTPGCYSYSYNAYEIDRVPAPLGAADAFNTWCCSALPTGGLGPLPGVRQYFEYNQSFPGLIDIIWLTMMTCNPAVGDPELVVAFEADNLTATHYLWVASYDTTTGSYNLITSQSSGTVAVAGVAGYFGCPYPVWTRMLDIDNSQDLSPLTTPGGPTLVFPAAVATDPNGDAGHLFCYPAADSGPPAARVYPFGGTVLPGGTPGTPGFTIQDIVVPGTNITGQAIGYVGRVLVLGTIPYPWPAAGLTFGTNENIDFTDPPNSNVLPPLDATGQQAYLDPQNPFGYGGAGSISVGELALIKKRGGLIVVTGDIKDPTLVTPYPGVQSTGDLYGRVGLTPLGLVYGSERAGAWAWNGGNAATKLSPQLDDAFFDCTTSEGMTGGGGFPSKNYGFNVEWWGDLILFSNNWVYNLLTNSWWVLYPQAEDPTDNYTPRQYFHYSRGPMANQMFASPIKLTTDASPYGADMTWIALFDNTYPSSHYQWQSLPVRVSEGRVFDIRRVTVRASCATANGSVTVSVIGSDGGVLDSHTTTTDIVAEGTLFTWDMGQGALGRQNITIRVNADNSTPGDPAPTVWALSVAYTEAAHVPTQQQLMIE